MMSKINDGGPAFPGEKLLYREGYVTSEREPVAGMSLRDYFAAHAPAPPYGMPLSEHCEYRYRYADAMLAARKASHD